MNDWLSIPAKTRIELLREYKRNGISYTQAKKDFLDSYPDGGTVPKDNTNVNTPKPLLLDKINAQENPKFPFETASPRKVTIAPYKEKTPELQQQVNKDYKREQIGNFINDIGTNTLTLATEFRKPTEEEITTGRGSWKDRIPLVTRAATQGLINEMIPKVLDRSIPYIQGGINKLENIVNPNESIYHFSNNPNLTLDMVDPFRVGSSQMKRRYKTLPVEDQPAGFYTTKNKNMVFMGGNEGYEMRVPKNLKVKNLAEEGRVTDRVPQKELKGYLEEGFDIIKGKNMIGQEEWILLNKDKIKSFKNIGTRKRR